MEIKWKDIVVLFIPIVIFDKFYDSVILYRVVTFRFKMTESIDLEISLPIFVSRFVFKVFFTDECHVWTSDYSPETFNICIDIVSFKKIKLRAFHFCDKNKHSFSLKGFRAHLKNYIFKQILIPIELALLKIKDILILLEIFSYNPLVQSKINYKPWTPFSTW